MGPLQSLGDLLLQKPRVQDITKKKIKNKMFTGVKMATHEVSFQINANKN